MNQNGNGNGRPQSRAAVLDMRNTAQVVNALRATASRTSEFAMSAPTQLIHKLEADGKALSESEELTIAMLQRVLQNQALLMLAMGSDLFQQSQRIQLAGGALPPDLARIVAGKG